MPASASWELKGVHLGSSVDDLNQVIPNANCETMDFDPDLIHCTAATTLADKHSVFDYLEGAAVQISFTGLTLDQTDAAEPALVAKFGVPTMRQLFWGEHLPHNSRLRYKAYEVSWVDGDTLLRIDPFAFKRKRSGKTYAKVFLQDTKKFEGEWVYRNEHKGDKPQVASDI